MSGRVEAERRGSIGVLTLSQPERLNAMSLGMWEALREAAAELGADRELRVLVVRGEDGEAFSAGADISEFRAVRGTVEAGKRYNAAVVAAQAELMHVRKPTIAMLHGVCAGGGAGIALACGLRFADDALRFSIPAAKLGVVYETEVVERLVREVGPSYALDILASARTVGADEALAIGLVNRVVPTGELEAAVFEYAERIARGAPLSIEGAWVAIRAAEEPANARWRDELASLEEHWLASEDYREGVAAFLEKRRATFSGR